MPPKKKKELVRFRPRLQDERRQQYRFASKERALKLAELAWLNLACPVRKLPLQITNDAFLTTEGIEQSRGLKINKLK